jgi:seryl-tRNA synthetase
MIDIRILRENPEIIKANITKKGQLDKLKLVDDFQAKDAIWRKLKGEADNLRAERNKVSQQINEAKKAGKDAAALLKEAKDIPAKIAEKEAEMAKLEEENLLILGKLPNIMWKDVPVGKDGSDNPTIKKWGKIPEFDFPAKGHVEILEALGVADFEAAARVSGNGFYYLKGDFARLSQALIRYATDMMAKKGYTYIEPPLMLNEKSIFASMDKSAIEQSVYSIIGEDLHLIGTSEQSVLAMHTGQAIPESELPKKYFAYSMCFRKEVGAHGINEKGLWRTHQFNKVEQFVFSKPEDSEKLYDEMGQNSEDILQGLELPYRKIEICTGDLADWKYRSADFEVYRPTTKEYGEVMSLSNCTEYQARKLNIKCIGPKGERRVLHTLNNTALASSRIMVAIVENYQQKDGTILVPKILRPYMGGIEKIEKKN